MTIHPKKYDQGLMWFRRDLRSQDNAALYHGLRECRRLWCVFVFDSDILDPLLAKGLRADRRVEFIHDSLLDLDEQLRALGRAHGHENTGLIVCHGRAVDQLPALAARLGVQVVYTNHDDEPQARQRDAQVLGALAHGGTLLQTYKDHVVFERREVLNQSGRPFTVYTPYRKAWLRKVTPYYLRPYPVERHATALAPCPPHTPPGVPTLQSLGFEPSNLRSLRIATGSLGAQGVLEDFAARIEHYHQARDFPAIRGPSYLSVHLRFGTLSIRQAAGLAYQMHLHGMAGASAWLDELIWRDFYHQILSHFPHVVGHCFKPAYDPIRWEHGRHAQALFDAWREGRTGYPLVDAAMHQLDQTGYMHNRLRMVTASFLCKDLGLDWRWGEQHFADHLIDFDLAANNGGWQWAASTGCDAQPYFRIFNPVSQSERFDPHGKFIRRYLPQLAGLPSHALHAPWKAKTVELESAGIVLGRDYPLPVVDHAQARQITLARYATARRKT